MSANGGSNLGRWGRDDQRGTLNLLTPEVVKKAAGLVRIGKVYSLSAPVGADGPKAPRRSKTWHVVSVFDNPGGHGDSAAATSGGGADDMLVTHVHTSTHMDALSHIWYDDHLYNGHPAASVTRFGAAKCGIENVRWLIGRGVLLDIAALKGVDHLDDRYAVTPGDLDDAARRQGTEVRPGDIVLVRTGWYRMCGESNDERHSSSFPGLDPSAGDWLAQHDVCAVGSDNVAVEVWSIDVPTGLPLHKRALRDLGCYLIEFLNLEELAADETYEFLFVAAPLRIIGGVGSPLNPLAIA